MKLLIAACALIVASSVLAGCGGLSAKQRLARREAIQLFPHVGLVASGHPKIASIDIRGGNWADVIVQGHFTVPNEGCLSGSCPPSIAQRARLGFALRDPQHHWRMSYDLGHGF